MGAWFAGAFERCLELCSAVRARDPESRVHVALLNARALLRLDRAGEALRVLGDAASIPSGVDESVALCMLKGAAEVRNGEIDRGLATLAAAQTATGDAHRTIQSEIQLNIALALYGRHDFDAADRALNGVDPDSDIVYARALEYRGWIAYARDDADRATSLFRAALDTLERCRHYDRFLEANCVRALAHLAVERLDARTWSLVEERRARMDWSATGLAQPRFWIAYCAAAFAMDVHGNPLKAAREARFAENIAPTEALRVQARCKRAAIARCADEPLSHRDHTESAVDIYHELKANTFIGDEAIVPLIVAEELAHLPSASDARSAFDAYLKLSRTSPILLMTHSSTTYAYQRFVEATVFESAGDRRTALRRYREAFEIYARIGYKRRAVVAALRLARLSRESTPDAYVVAHTRRLSAQSWLRREAHAMNQPALRLTTVQREVLGLICQGKSNPDIARLRKRSLHTIRNLVARLFVIFAVSSREELAVECVRRGLYAPK